MNLQVTALQFPTASSFEAVSTQETLLSELSKVEESFIKQTSRVKWLNEGDQNTKYFHRVVKGRQSKLKIVAIQNEEGSTLTDEKSIILEFRRFYEDFLGVADSNCNGGTDEFFQSLQLASLPMMSIALCLR